MTNSTTTRFWLSTIRFIGLIVPSRLRADWRQEWEAELRHREALLAEWDKLDWRNKLDLWRRSVGAFKDALVLQPQRLEDEMFQDLRFGLRMLLKHKSFTLIAVTTLALGIGANTAIFSVVDKVLLRSLTVKDPQALALVSGETVNPKFMNNIFSYPDYVDYREQNEVFSGLAAFAWITARLGEGEGSDKFSLEAVSGNFFDVLGVAAAQGRVIQDEDNRNEDAHPVAVISYSCWQRRFAGKPNVVGQTLLLNGASYTIIGIAPAGFAGTRLEASIEAWVPLMMRRQLTGATTLFRKSAWLRLLGRLKPGATL